MGACSSEQQDCGQDGVSKIVLLNPMHEFSI